MTAEEKQQARVHVTFGPSATGSLKIAFKTLGRNEEVLGLVDDFSFGPIASADRRRRTQWNADELGFDVDPDFVAYDEEFWERIHAVRTEIVVWMSRRDVQEYCGFLNLLCEVQDAPVSIVDVADVKFVGLDGAALPDASKCFGSIPTAHIIDRNLLDRATRVSSAERDAFRVEWQRLQDENAAVRVLTPTGLVSAPISQFDAMIISCISSEWQKCARVIGNSIFKLTDGEFHQLTNVEFLWSRLLTLMDGEVVEGKNEQELWSMHESWVRRSASNSPGQ